MPTDNLPASNPTLDDFVGDSPRQVARRLLHATRPKFFPASVLPVLAGTAWGSKVSGMFEPAIFLLALLATICVHAAVNVLNDVGDDSGGTDRVNEDRIYPYTGVALGVLYSLGPVRLSGLGIGETAVAVGFGILPVTGAAWLQSGTFNGESLLFSLPISAWVAAILLVNEVPDIDPDGDTGKRTLPVRLGLGGTAMLYLGLHIFALAAIIYTTVIGLLPKATPVLPVILLFLAFRASTAIRRGIQNRDGMQRAIEGTLGIHMLGSLWLCGLVLFAAL